MESLWINIFQFVLIMTTVGVFGQHETVDSSVQVPTQLPEVMSYLNINYRRRNETSKELQKTNITTPKKWIQECIKKHNEYRKLHSAPPLQFNNTLTEIAQSHANEIARTFKVENNDTVLSSLMIGENIYYKITSFPMNLEAVKPVTAWYDESNYYDFKTGLSFDEDKEILSFAQLVWIGTSDVGVAYAKTRRPDRKYCTYVVANYWPRGNYDDFLVNVLPPVRDTDEYVDGSTSNSSDLTTSTILPIPNTNNTVSNSSKPDVITQDIGQANEKFSGIASGSKLFRSEIIFQTWNLGYLRVFLLLIIAR